jgi:hypothetical protein
LSTVSRFFLPLVRQGCATRPPALTLRLGRVAPVFWPAPRDFSAGDRARNLDGMTTASDAGTPSDPPENPAAQLVFEDLLSQPSVDDTDAGWGERPSQAGGDDLVRFLDEKPPHHL